MHRQSDGRLHRSGAGAVLAHNVERRAVIHTGTDDRQSERHVDGVLEAQQLDGDQALIVVHGNDQVVPPADGVVEDRIGGERALHVDALLPGGGHGGLDEPFLLVAKQPLLPSTWLSELMTSFAKGSGTALLFNFLLLTTTALFSISLSVGVASRLYRRTWTASKDRSGTRQEGKDYSRPPRKLLPGILGGQRQALVEKDLRLFFRDATQWSQAAILFGLLAIYILSLRRTPIYFTTVFWRNLISLVNLGFTGYVFATISIRFVYPAISLEGQALWVVRSTPLSIRDLFWGKLILNLALGTVLVEAIILSSNLLLQVDPIITAISMVAVLFFACSLVSISIGFGAGMPDLKESNPSKIASGPGGILAAVTSLAYVGLSVSIMAWPGYAYLASEMGNTSLPYFPFVISGMAFLVLNSLATGLPLYLGMRSLSAREI